MRSCPEGTLHRPSECRSNRPCNTDMPWDISLFPWRVWQGSNFMVMKETKILSVLITFLSVCISQLWLEISLLVMRYVYLYFIFGTLVESINSFLSMQIWSCLRLVVGFSLLSGQGQLLWPRSLPVSFTTSQTMGPWDACFVGTGPTALWVFHVAFHQKSWHMFCPLPGNFFYNVFSLLSLSSSFRACLKQHCLEKLLYSTSTKHKNKLLSNNLMHHIPFFSSP